jgi:26S proteasome regulatory subunit N7
MISLDRVTLKKKVVHSPEVVGAIREMPDLKIFLDSFVKCDYRTLFIKFGILGISLYFI